MLVSKMNKTIQWLRTKPEIASVQAIRVGGLGTAELVGIMFFFTCGGPYGVETIVRTAGPMISMAGIALTPFFWCIPMGLMSAELATAIPADGGNILWVERGLGPCVGFINGLLRVATGVADLALYPIISVRYMDLVLPDSIVDDDTNRYLFGLIVVVIAWVLNVLGVDAVGRAALILTILILMPYIVFVGVSIPDINTRKWSVVPNPDDADLGVDWPVFLSVLLWATAGFDDAGSLAGSVKDPARSYLSGLIITVILVMLVYLLPIATGVCLLDWQEWDVGAFKNAAESKGHWLQVWIAFAVFTGCVGSFNSLLCADAMALKCMASLRWIPSCFSYSLPKLDTPVLAITVMCIAASVLGLFDFEFVIQLETCLLSMSIFLEFLSCIRLRYVEPTLARPFVIPLSNAGLIAFFFPPMALCVFAVVTVVASEVTILIAAVGVVILAAALYYVRHLCGIQSDPNFYDAIHSPSGNSPFPDDERNPLLEVQRSAGGLNQVDGGLVL
eukprot:m.58474 g.58474  ORF g.58474 m.58474 type:complete len:503 (+) comp17226_c0_seq2:312-1820(+)